MGLRYLQTMKLSFEQICQGLPPWVPLGNFMNDWYELHIDCREQLIADPIPEDYPQEFHYWAVFCAASIEWFAHKYDVVCPAWVYAPQYKLAVPHFSSENRQVDIVIPAMRDFHHHLCLGQRQSASSEKEALRMYYLTEAPEEFTRRNIFCGDRMFANKWEALDGYLERKRKALA
ncbi:MAG TPA: hypothetical protein VGM01_09710 [Ktedonobacteraceae bacterium]